jgi:diguanylate cyclase (GGDEF)-like protein
MSGTKGPVRDCNATEAAEEEPAIVAGAHTEDVLEMLAVRSSDALPSWLAARIGAWYPGARRRILRVYPVKAARIKQLPDYEAYSVAELHKVEAPVPVGVDTALAEAVSSRRPLTVSNWDGGARLLAALEANGEVRYLVELFGDMAPAARDTRLASLLAIAAKYYERLVDAETDPLTKLANRGVFHAHVDAGIKRWTASDRNYYFAILDIDHFKRVNDTFGHVYGDEILVHFANLMKRTFRAGDLLYRVGGEEFVLIYGVDPPYGGESTLERFRKAVEAYPFPGVGHVTVSIGYTRISEPLEPTGILIDRADSAVYYAKSHGRNRVCCWEDLAEHGELPAEPASSRDVTLF